MNDLAILIVEDEPEVRDALIRDVAPFEGQFVIESAEDVDDARAALASLEAAGQSVALVLCDHLLPGMHGVDFLVELNEDPKTSPARKVLVTGQAGLEDTIRAVNEADLDHYIAKPWDDEELQDTVREQLTEYVSRWVDNLLPYVPILDGPKLMAIIAARGFDR
ncbi:MAG: response regulator [Acidimicrobiia bacterium]|jgi:two-component system chemotaxis response regulator CheY